MTAPHRTRPAVTVRPWRTLASLGAFDYDLAGADPEADEHQAADPGTVPLPPAPQLRRMLALEGI
jgi:hypothetical protein